MREMEGRLATLAALIQSKAAMNDRKIRQYEMVSDQEKKDTLLKQSIELDGKIGKLEDKLQLLISKKRNTNKIVETVMKQAAEIMGTSTENQQPASANPSPPSISAAEKELPTDRSNSYFE